MPKPLTASFFCIALALDMAGCTTKNYGDEAFHLGMATHGKDVMWVPTKQQLVSELLAAAKVQSSDIVYDLGSGDGIIPIEAAKQFGVRAVGIEYNPDLVALSKRNAKRAGVEQLVTLKRGDIFVEDFSQATVLTLYLGENLNIRLKPKIFQMKPGTRVVSNTFRMGSWMPDQTIRTASGDTGYLWIVPAALDGEWSVEGLPGMAQATLSIRQKKQFFDGSLDAPNAKRMSFEDGRIQGNGITFAFRDNSGARYTFAGQVEGNRLVGTLNNDPALPMRAERKNHSARRPDKG